MFWQILVGLRRFGSICFASVLSQKFAKSRGGKGGENRREVKLSADGAFGRVAGLEVIVLDDLPETE
jgi:hypothetical protein